MTTYPVPLGTRFAYDVDGTRVFRTTAAHDWAEIPRSMLPLLIRSDSGVYWLPDTTQTNKLALFFPEPRDITAVFLAATFNLTGSNPYSYTVGGNKDYNSSVKDYPVRCETSTDTSDGINGTWNPTSFIRGNPRAVVASDGVNPWPSVYQQGYYMGASAVRHRVPGEAQVGWSPYGGRAVMTYRTGAADLYSDVGGGPAPLTGNSVGVRALRIWLETYNSSSGKYEFQSSMFVQMLHVYGRLASTAPAGQLVPWHATENRPLTQADTDQGNVAQGTTGYVNFRVKNLDLNKTALALSVFIDIPLFNSSPSLEADAAVSVNGSDYSQSCIVDTLAPGALSPIITVRRSTSQDAAMGVSSFRVGMSVKSWEV